MVAPNLSVLPIETITRGRGRHRETHFNRRSGLQRGGEHRAFFGGGGGGDGASAL